MQEFYRTPLSALNNFHLATVRFNTMGVLTYLNEAGQRLLGHPGIGMKLSELFPDETEYAVVQTEMRLRMEGKSSIYQTSFRQYGSEPQDELIPISVYAFPDTDENGKVIGTIAMIQDLREDEVNRALHRAIQVHRKNSAMFDDAVKQLRRLLPFHEFRINTVSKSRHHIRRLYTTDASARQKYPYRWWTMPPFIQKTFDNRVSGIIQLDELRRQPDYEQMLKVDLPTKRYFDSGVRQILSIPVKQNGRTVAFIGLDSMEDNCYTEQHLELLKRLPLSEMVLAAMHREASHQQQAIVNLIRRVGATANDILDIAKAITSCLQRNFGWNHVSIFQMENGAHSMRLICQANYKHAPLPPDFQFDCNPAQDHAVGRTIANAAISRSRVNQPASRDGSPYAHTPEFNKEGSALAIPINGRRCQWVIYVESELSNAFAEEEEELLDFLATESTAVLHRASLFELQAAVLSAINDAVVETNRDGSIRWANPAAQHLLGLPQKPVDTIHITSLIDDPELHRLMQPSDYRALDLQQEETVLSSLGGKKFPALLSASRLQPHLGGQVFVISDLTYQRQTRQLDELDNLLRHAAQEGRVPLALAASWLDECLHGQEVTPELIHKIRRQLGRADLPMERLMRLVSTLSPSARVEGNDLGQALEITLGEMPGAMLEDMELTATRESLPVAVELNDMQFCVESLISFGLRTRPQSKRLHIHTESKNGQASLRVSGDWAPNLPAPDAAQDGRWQRKTLIDLALGEQVIKDIVGHAGGSYRRQFDAGMMLEITLPLHKEINHGLGAHRT